MDAPVIVSQLRPTLKLVNSPHIVFQKHLGTEYIRLLQKKQLCNAFLKITIIRWIIDYHIFSYQVGGNFIFRNSHAMIVGW